MVESEYLRTGIPDFRPGDTVKVHVRVVEGTRERVQVFQGVVIRRQNGGLRETFTVRKISFGVGVERTFPMHSPTIAKIEVVSRGQVRRAKLYYLRELRGKKARIKERRLEEDLLVVEDMAPAEEALEEVPEASPEEADATDGGADESPATDEVVEAKASDDADAPASEDADSIEAADDAEPADAVEDDDAKA